MEKYANEIKIVISFGKKGSEIMEQMTAEECFFYEWLIIHKGITEEAFKQLTDDDMRKLRIQYAILKIR